MNADVIYRRIYQRHFQDERSLESDEETGSSRRKLQIELRGYQQIRIAPRLLDIEISIDRETCAVCD
jgi:hypothetical protein